MEKIIEQTSECIMSKCCSHWVKIIYKTVIFEFSLKHYETNPMNTLSKVALFFLRKYTKSLKIWSRGTVPLK